MLLDNFWRTELWHPLSVHFPIALLLVSTLIMLFTFFIKDEKRMQVRTFGTLILVVGSVTAWISIYTGNMADGIVARKICDPTILKDHEIAAQTMTYLFTTACLIKLLFFFDFVKQKLHLILTYLSLLLMIVGSGFLIHASHLGARLVYQQGAGVYNHSVECE